MVAFDLVFTNNQNQQCVYITFCKVTLVIQIQNRCLIHLYLSICHIYIYIFLSPYNSVNCSLRGDPYKYNMLPPLPAQRNLTPPPTLYPQQPVSGPESYSLPRFAMTGSSEISSARSKRTDINV